MLIDLKKSRIAVSSLSSTCEPYDIVGYGITDSELFSSSSNRQIIVCSSSPESTSIRDVIAATAETHESY